MERDSCSVPQLGVGAGRGQAPSHTCAGLGHHWGQGTEEKVRGSLWPALRSHKKGPSDPRSDDWFGFLILMSPVEINWLIPRNAWRSLRLAELVGYQTDHWGGAWLVLEGSVTHPP